MITKLILEEATNDTEKPPVKFRPVDIFDLFEQCQLKYYQLKEI